MSPVALTACTKDAVKPGEPVAARPVDPTLPSTPPPKAKAVPMPEDTCRVFAKLPQEPPIYMAGKGVVVTRLMKPCVTRDGQRGYEKNTPWLAMGFPCTGGSGRIELKGNYYNPKMVTFIVSNGCGMMPASKDVVEKMVHEAFDLPKEARLMAYTPFVVQYWEVPQVGEAATGFAIELRSAAATEKLWKKFKDQPVRVKLYGREDAWGQGNNFYFVEADLKMTGRNAFQLEVLSVKPLTKEEVTQTKERCEAIRPKQNCGEVF
jgi:hypothetical protein